MEVLNWLTRHGASFLRYLPVSASEMTVADTDTYTITDYDVNMTDSRSEFSEYSLSRKSSAPTGLHIFFSPFLLLNLRL